VTHQFKIYFTIEWYLLDHYFNYYILDILHNIIESTEDEYSSPIEISYITAHVFSMNDF